MSSPLGPLDTRPQVCYPMYKMQESKPIDVQVVEPGQADTPEDDTGEEALLSRIPLQSGDKRKAQYLSWRATGFSVREACDLTPVSFGTLLRWRKHDPEFAEFEDKWLRELQKETSRDLIHLEFMRNMRLALHRDYKVLFKAAYDLESLSPAEAAYLKLIRRLYTPQDMVVLEKALEPESARGPTTVNAIVIHVDGKAVEGEAASRAAARDLLDRFTVNAKAAAELPEGDDSTTGDKDGD